MKAVLFLVFIFASANLGRADFVLYDESISGDLNPPASLPQDQNLGLPLVLLDLQAGTNLIRGTMTYGGTLDIDAFAFRVASNQMVDRIEMDAVRISGDPTSVTMAVSTGVSFNNSNIDDPPRPPILGIVNTSIPGQGISVTFPTFLPLNGGDYNMSFDQGVIGGNGTGANSFSWTATFTVSAVPEPATTPLVAMGLIGIFTWLRNKMCLRRHIRHQSV